MPAKTNKETVKKVNETFTSGSRHETGTTCIDIDRIIAEVDIVMVEGNYKMPTPSGKQSMSAFCDVYRIQNVKIPELHSYFNNESANDPIENKNEYGKM